MIHTTLEKDLRDYIAILRKRDLGLDLDNDLYKINNEIASHLERLVNIDRKIYRGHAISGHAGKVRQSPERRKELARMGAKARWGKGGL